MAAVTAPSSGKSLLGKLASALSARSRRKTGRPSKAAAFVADHAGTIAALGFADVAMWHLGSFWGYLGTGVAILVADFKVQG